MQWGSLEGRVVWKGALPKVESLVEKIAMNADGAVILKKAPKELLVDPTYRIDPKNRGVANVTVFFKLTPTDRLPIHADDKIRKKAIILDAPFCIFQPHMTAFYPEWNDGKNHGETGQKFIIKNTSELEQNARFVGLPDINSGVILLRQAGFEKEVDLKPQRLPLSVYCDIHVWMKAHIWVFDHPYFAISKDDGSFEIPRVPTGISVQVMAWHESCGWLFTAQGKTMKLTEGKNVLNFDFGPK